MFKIDEEKCIHCGMCIKDCSANALSFNENKIPEINEYACFKCQHCLAVCPTGALSILEKYPENSDEIMLQDSEKVLNLIKSRRSIRHYKQENLDREKLEKLKNMLNWVPTGCNNHRLHFSFIDDIDVMNDFRCYVNGIITNALTKTPVKAILGKFGRYKKTFLNGADIVFRGAPHLIVAATPVDAPCYEIDPTIALSYFELYAQSMGVGTCWCGLGEYCLKVIPELSEYLKIPQNYKASYMMLFGEPDVKYSRTVQPEQVSVTSVEKTVVGKMSLIDKFKRYSWNLK